MFHAELMVILLNNKNMHFFRKVSGFMVFNSILSL